MRRGLIGTSLVAVGISSMLVLGIPPASIDGAAAVAPTYIGGGDLAALSEAVANVTAQGNQLFLASPDNAAALAQGAANASQKHTSIIATGSTTTAVLAQIARRTPVPTTVSLVGAPTDFSADLKTALSAAYTLDQTFVSADPVQWSLAAHDAAYRTRIVIGDGAVAHSQAYAAAYATVTHSSLVLIDASHQTGVAPLIQDPTNSSTIIFGDLSSFSELSSLADSVAARLSAVPLDDLAQAALRVAESTINGGASAKKIVASNADDPATMALAARYAGSINAVIADRANAGKYLNILRSAPTSTTLVGVGASASGGASLAAEQPAPAPRPDFRAINTTISTSAGTFSVQFTTVPGAASYTARDDSGTVVATTATDTVSVSGAPYNLAITATSSSGGVLGTIQYKVNSYSTNADRVHTVMASSGPAGTYIKPLNSTALPRLITRTQIPAAGGVPQEADTVNIAITCEPNYTDPAQSSDYQYDYRVYTLSNDPSTCEGTGTAGDSSTLDTVGFTLPAAVVAASASGAASVSRASSVAADTAPAATQSAAQRSIEQARASSAARPGSITPQAVGDDWPAIIFRYQTFIPPALIWSPGVTGDITRPFVFYNGNNRYAPGLGTYRPLYDPFGEYKTREDVTVTFGSSHSVSQTFHDTGTTRQFKCRYLNGTSCVQMQTAKQNINTVQLLDVSSNATGGAFRFHIDSANPLFAAAPPINADLRVTMAPSNTWITGSHDYMPVHEIYFDVEGWNEWQMVYGSGYWNIACLAGGLPGCTAYLNIPL